MAVGSRNEHKALRRDSPVSPTFNMSYNPSAPVSGTAVAQPLATQLDGHDLQPAFPPPSAKTLHDKRRHSRGKLPPQIKRSSSTPHMRALALGESSPISPNSDKRRNKLGYHRTSVACGTPVQPPDNAALLTPSRTLSSKEDKMSAGPG